MEIAKFVDCCWSRCFGSGFWVDARAREAAYAAPAAADVLATAEPGDGAAEWFGDRTLSFVLFWTCICVSL